MTSRVLVLDGSRPLTRAEVGGKAFSVNDMRRLADIGASRLGLIPGALA